jgi:hypothetical protein
MADTDIGFEQAVINGIVQDMDAMSEAMGHGMGMPPGGKHYSQREQDEMYNASPIADPTERAQTMTRLYQEGIVAGTDPQALVEQITDQVYPDRRRLIESGRPDPRDQIAYAKQMERQLARQARDQGVHIPGVEPWASITQENAPPEPESVQTMPGQMADATVAQATSVPGWAEPGGQFGLTGPQI